MVDERRTTDAGGRVGYQAAALDATAARLYRKAAEALQDVRFLADNGSEDEQARLSLTDTLSLLAFYVQP